MKPSASKSSDSVENHNRNSSSRIGRLFRLGMLLFWACALAFSLMHVVRGLTREGNGAVAFYSLGFLITLLLVAIALQLYIIQRTKGINRALLSQLESVSRHLPKATLWSRNRDGNFQWFFTQETDTHRVAEQIKAALTAKPYDPNLIGQPDLDIASDLEGPTSIIQRTFANFSTEANTVEIGLGDRLVVGMSHHIDSISETSPVIQALLPMVNDTFRMYLYSADLKTVTVYWTKDRWKLELGVPLDSSITWACIHPDDLENLRNVFVQCVNTRTSGAYTYRYIGPDGTDSLTMASTFTPIYDAVGNLRGILSIALDISSGLIESLDSVRNKISVRIYEQFLTRLPIFTGPVLERLDTLSSSMETESALAGLEADPQSGMFAFERAQEICAQVGLTANKLRRDLNDLSGAISFMADSTMSETVTESLAPHSLAEASQEVISEMSEVIRERSIRVKLEIEAARGFSMGLVNPAAFHSALSMVLHNSVRFSPVGGMVVVVVRDDPADPRGYLIIDIFDDGPGPDGVDYSDITKAHLLASPIQSGIRDETVMVFAMLMLLKQGIHLSYQARNPNVHFEQSGLHGQIRVRRAA
ncbi:PAS domain-containing protein [Hydrogenophaga sp. 2FB]|uniref:PAS domain-containing protein n=1 Tax=Hydrogenophaga sp. 2FB TaxID=2502187 RepID=UPI0010F67053|nr:PAS domain-containing protein [Hydrogenophaga sp. 2FB]